MRIFFIETRKVIYLFITLFTVTGLCIAAYPLDTTDTVDLAEGFWISVDEKTGQAISGWQFYQEGGRLYGKILSFSNNSGSSSNTFVPGVEIGTPWIYWNTMVKPGEWKDSSFLVSGVPRNVSFRLIFRPQDGRRYLIDTLEMRVNILLGIGRSTFLQRSDERTASSL